MLRTGHCMSCILYGAYLSLIHCVVCILVLGSFVPLKLPAISVFYVDVVFYFLPVADNKTRKLLVLNSWTPKMSDRKPVSF